MSIYTYLLALALLPLLLAYRIRSLLPSRSPSRPPKRKSGETCSLGIFMGSGASLSLPLPAYARSGEPRAGSELRGAGGHTAEMMALLSTLPLERYTPRTYVYCHGDALSPRLVDAFEQEQSHARSHSDAGSRSRSGAQLPTPKDEYSLIALPRARQVAQSYASSVLTTLHTLRVALVRIIALPLLRSARRPWVDVLLVNGPGTCVVVVACCWVRRVSLGCSASAPASLGQASPSLLLHRRTDRIALIACHVTLPVPRIDSD